MEDKDQVSKKQEEFTPNWGYFLFFGTFSVFSILFGEGWVVLIGGLMFGTLSLLSWPNKKGHAWIMKQVSSLKKLANITLKYGFYLVLIFLGLWFVGKIFNGIDGMGKYQGLTAKEWYYEYAEVEYALDQANSNIEDAKWYAWESYEEMGEALDYLEPVYP